MHAQAAQLYKGMNSDVLQRCRPSTGPLMRLFHFPLPRNLPRPWIRAIKSMHGGTSPCCRALGGNKMMTTLWPWLHFQDTLCRWSNSYRHSAGGLVTLKVVRAGGSKLPANTVHLRAAAMVWRESCTPPQASSPPRRAITRETTGWDRLYTEQNRRNR